MNSFAHSALVIAVEENETVLNVTPSTLGMEHVKVRTYLEAVGLMVAHKLGVNPAALTANVGSIRKLEVPRVEVPEIEH